MTIPENKRSPVFVKKHFGEDPAPHGGGWKVAMADLMISMFALFLILWLLQVLDSEDREKLAEYFKTGGSQGLLETTGGDSLIEGVNTISPIDLENVATSHSETNLHRINDTSLLQGEVDSEQQLELLASRVKEQIERLNGTSSVQVQVTPQGLRMVIHDSDKGSMFSRGGTNLTYFYEDLLLGLGPLFSEVKNSVIITGHTDASRFVGSKTTNWELSASRAGVARYYLERGGMPANRVFKVSGVGDTRPINKEDPRSAVNRRVELFLLTKAAREEMDRMFDSIISIDESADSESSMSDQYQRAFDAAKNNQLAN